jgi:nucleotide-binding universal stress UspA family protein
MMKRILVPLDGSRLAERALLTAGGLAESLVGMLVLLRVVPPQEVGRAYAPYLLEQLEEAQVKEAGEYLRSVAARLSADRLNTESHVLVGPVAQTITREAKHLGRDLITICSHGMGHQGIRDGQEPTMMWPLGSVALRLVENAQCPVLVARPTAEELEVEEEEQEQVVDEAILRELTSTERSGKLTGGRQ